MHKTLFASALALGLALTALPAAAQNMTCKLSFSSSSWSIFYKTTSGTGTVTCSNGQSLPVRITAKGGGLTVGKSKITNGFGEFAEVRQIRDVLGSYASAEAHAGTVKSANAQAMTNGKVSLALAGKGEGWDLGVAFSKFTLEAR
jgi:predicted Zn-dependent protease